MMVHWQALAVSVIIVIAILGTVLLINAIPARRRARQSAQRELIELIPTLSREQVVDILHQLGIIKTSENGRLVMLRFKYSSATITPKEMGAMITTFLSGVSSETLEQEVEMVATFARNRYQQQIGDFIDGASRHVEIKNMLFQAVQQMDVEDRERAQNTARKETVIGGLKAFGCRKPVDPIDPFIL
jgi:hypothetical protein